MIKEIQKAYKNSFTQETLKPTQNMKDYQPQIKNRRKRLSREEFITQTERNLCKSKRYIYYILKHLNEEIRETRDIRFTLRGNLYLQYYQKLWDDTGYKQETWGPHMYDKEEITLDNYRKLQNSSKCRSTRRKY
jgi:hypothetical protein